MSTYSYWHFRTAKYPVERVIEDAARLGFDGVEILHRQMTDESTAYVNWLDAYAQTGLIDVSTLTPYSTVGTRGTLNIAERSSARRSSAPA